MPQLDFANHLTISQVVWMAFIFAALYFLLARWALPQVAEVLDSRAARIAADLDTANTAKNEADAAVAEITRASRDANSEAQASIASAVNQAKAEAAEQARVASAELDAQLSQAEQRIAAARSAAMGALRQVASETAGAVVSRLTGTVPDSATVDAAVSRVMARA